jgi:hypothetical protein
MKYTGESLGAWYMNEVSVHGYLGTAGGPGSGPWQTAPPEQHGLSSSELAAAAEHLGKKAPHRCEHIYCIAASRMSAVNEKFTGLAENSQVGPAV